MERYNILLDLALELDKNQAHRLADTITNQIKIASDDYDHEYDMVRNQMAWVQSKITNAVEMLDGVSDYLQSHHKTASDKNKGKKLNKPFRTPGGPKKFSVYVKNDKGNTIKVNFGDPNMKIKDNIPGRRKNFRARHNCETPGPKTKARYWSCRQWSDSKSDI
jgi:hypothetical protein